MKKHIPNLLSALRIVCADAMIFVVSPSTAFFALYAVCGLSDVLDGHFARAFDAQTELGSKLDSAADLVFVIVCAIKIIPLMSLPKWLVIWIIAIAAAKLLALIISFIRSGSFGFRHSYINRLTGAALFLTVPLFMQPHFAYYAIPVCIAATFAAADDLIRGNNK